MKKTKKEPKRFLTSGGYLAFYEKDKNGKYKTILVHRRVMELHLGRKLWPCEIVHHINGDRTDNRIENLEITARGRHMTGHSKNHPWRLKNRTIGREFDKWLKT